MKDMSSLRKYVWQLSRDSKHVVVGTFSNGAQLHRFINPGGLPYSSIYEGYYEPMNTLRENEERMIRSYCYHSKVTYTPFKMEG